MAGGIHLRLPYQSDPETRKRINAGEMDYMDIHLSHVAQFVEYGFLGKLDVALIEVTAVLEDGRLVPSSSIGNNKTWIEQAERVILEVNSWQPDRARRHARHLLRPAAAAESRTDSSRCIPASASARPYLKVPAGEGRRHRADRLSRPQQRRSRRRIEASQRIAGHILEFLSWEVQKGRMPANLLPLQSGVGNIANAVLFGLEEGPFRRTSPRTPKSFRTA